MRHLRLVQPIRELVPRAGERRDGDVEMQVRRYAGRFRRRLRRLGETSPKCADLLFTFPGLSVALVSGHGTPRAREEALQLARSGARLADVALALQLPAWLRWLPPEAFDRPLPSSLRVQASDPEFGRRIVQLRPSDPRDSSWWLQWVIAAREACDDEFAVWIAAQRIFESRRRLPFDCLVPLAMFAWFSRHQDFEAASYLNGQWTAKMNIGRAACLTRRWLHQVLHDLCFEDGCAASDWARARRVHGFDFVPLLTSGALIEEGAAMRNCLATYSANVVRGMCRLYSVRRDGERVATLEVRPVRGSGLPEIAQLLGPGNSKPTETVCAATLAWFDLQSYGVPGATLFSCGAASDAAFATHVWQPYARAVGATAQPGVAPSGVTGLLNSISALCILEKS